MPILQKTWFGWIVPGSVRSAIIGNKQSLNCNLNIMDIHNQLENFWMTEELHNEQNKQMSMKNSECEKLFV